MKESPIFIKSFETLLWLLEHTKKFPSHQRFVMAKRMEEAGLSFHDCIVWATKTKEKRKVLVEADYHLERLKIYNRLCLKMKLLAFNQYEYLAKELDELGRLLGGWIKKLQTS